MKKSTIKLTSALLMLNLMGTSLYAATATLDENVAATRIQRRVRLNIDKKLNEDFYSIFLKESVAENIQNDSKVATEYLRRTIDSLSEMSSLSEIAAPLTILFNANNFPDIVEPYLQKYQSYLDRERAHQSSIKRQWASLLKGFLEDYGYYYVRKTGSGDELKKMENLLQEAKDSHYSFFRFYYHERLSSVSKNSRDITQAIAQIKRGFTLPKRYHGQVYDRLADLFSYGPDSSDEHKKEQYYKKIIELGNPREKAKARYQLAGSVYSNQWNPEFYKPEDAIALYQSLLSEAMPVAFSVPYFSFFSQYYMQIRLADAFMRAPDGIKDEAEANRIFNEILEKKDYADWDYASAVYQIINVFTQHNPNTNAAINSERALSLALEFLGNPDFPEVYKKLIERDSLAQLYQSGPDGIRDPQKALELLEKHREDYNPRTSSQPNQQLISLLQHGPAEVQDHQRALRTLEELTDNSTDPNYLSNLQLLVNLLAYGDSTVKDVHRAIEICEGILRDQNIPKHYQQSTKGMLANLYQSGPEDIRNHSMAAQLLEECIEFSDLNGDRAYKLQSLAQLLQYGDEAVRNIERVIQIYEELRLKKDQKLYSLQKLSEIYANDPVHKNALKATECYRELVSLNGDKPIEQLKALTSLMNLNAADGEMFNPAEARAIAAQILAHPSVDGTARLAVQTALSELYQRHPEASTLEERINAHQELAQNPMANPENMRIAYQRLIALYLSREQLPQAVTTFEQLLGRAADWQRNEVICEYIAFLENPEYATVQNFARVVELRAFLPQFIPQLIPQDREPMAGVVHHVPGVVGGFGRMGYVEPSFSPEIRANVKASLYALSRDAFDRMNYQKNLDRTIAEVKEAIMQYDERDADFAAIAAVATEVFETGNNRDLSYRSVVNHLNFPLEVDGLRREMTYGEALVRIWARITHHPAVNHLKDLIVVQLAAARDPDGHIVCEFGKVTRHLQVIEGVFEDIKAVTLSVQNMFSHFTQQQAQAFDALAEDDSLKTLKAKCEEISGASEFKMDDEAHWVQEKYRGKFAALEAEEQSLLNDYYEQMVTGFEAELLKSRDTLSEDERVFVRREVGKYLSLWFM